MCECVDLSQHCLLISQSTKLEYMNQYRNFKFKELNLDLKAEITVKLVI